MQSVSDGDSKSQPLSVAVDEGVSVSLSVNAVGTAVTYEWQHRVDSSGDVVAGEQWDGCDVNVSGSIVIG